MSGLVWSLTRNGRPILQAAVGDHSGPQPTPAAVDELQQCGFEIEGREDDVEYGLWIGDVEAGHAFRGDQMPASTVGVPRGRFILWDDAAYFEGARGLVLVRLRSRPVDSSDAWQERALMPVAVVSGKLSEDRYATMLDQLSGLAAGLVLDLISKTTRSFRLATGPGDSQIRTSAVELRLLESVWPSIAAGLRQICENPAVSLRRALVTQACWGSERLEARSLATLARTGVDPRHASASVPFKTQVSRVHESTDILEHRLIRGFIELLLQRARECESNLVRHIQSMEDDRQWRERGADGEDSLYQLEDQPRLERLRLRLRKARELQSGLERARRTPPLARVRSVLSLKSTPILDNVGPYRSIRQSMLRFLKTGLTIVEEGVDERIKSTSRLYEQWVFLQLAAAFRAVGLTCGSQQGVLHTTRRFRFTLDLDRGARISFQSRQGQAVALRYEPWVMPREQAQQNRETVYRGRGGESAWSPDVLIEFLGKPAAEDAAASVKYAVVLDSKYTRTIRDHHWSDTAKYLQIRSTADGKQVVKQQWLAFPGAADQQDEAITLQDPNLQWSEAGPNCPHSDTVQGVLAISPPAEFDQASVADGWILAPEEAAVAFAGGLLRYLNVDIP